MLTGLSAGALLAGGTVLHWGGRDVDQLAPRQSGLRVTIEEYDASVRAGEHVSVTSTVTNESDAAVETTVDLVVGHDPEREGRIRTTLEAGESRTVTHGFDTFPVPRDEEFPIRVEADGGADERTVSVTGASVLDDATPDGEITVGPGTEVLFEVGAVDSGERQRTVWWVDGERVGDSMGTWPATYYAETDAHYRRETFEETGTVRVAAAVLPAERSETFTTHWEVEVTADGPTSPAVDDARPAERTVTAGEDDALEFELDASDSAGGLDRVVWWLTQADQILDVTELDGEADTATLTLDGDSACHTCHVSPWVICEDGRIGGLSDTWELQDAELVDDEPEDADDEPEDVDDGEPGDVDDGESGDVDDDGSEDPGEDDESGNSTEDGPGDADEGEPGDSGEDDEHACW